jgi:hypothetical protein
VSTLFYVDTSFTTIDQPESAWFIDRLPLIDCHQKAFVALGGVSRRILYDNMNTVVIERDVDGPTDSKTTVMARRCLGSGTLKLPRSASGLPTPRTDCCRWTPNRRNSEILVTGLVQGFARIGANFFHSGGYQIPIGGTPRFPPSRFIQRLPAPASERSTSVT